MLKDRPRIYEQILIFGGKSRDEAVIGGWMRRPHIALSYLLAARHVLEAGQREERLTEVALPAAYLQRHALEVELKDCLSAVYELKRDCEWLNLLRVDGGAPCPTKIAVPLSHRHNDLSTELTRALREEGLPDLPDTVVHLCERITASEANSAERFRYEQVRFGRERPLEAAFDKEEKLQVVETQNIMEDVFERVFHFDERPPEDTWTFGTRLSYECYAVAQAIEENYPSTSV